MKNGVIAGEGTKIDDLALVQRSVLGYNVIVGKNCKIDESVLFSGCKIEDNVEISHSIIGPNCTVKTKSKVTAGSIVGEGSIIDKGLFVENSLVQSEKPDDCKYLFFIEISVKNINVLKYHLNQIFSYSVNIHIIHQLRS